MVKGFNLAADFKSAAQLGRCGLSYGIFKKDMSSK